MNARLRDLKKNIRNSIYHMKSNGLSNRRTLNLLIANFSNPMYNQTQIRKINFSYLKKLSERQHVVNHDLRRVKKINETTMVLIRVSRI